LYHWINYSVVENATETESYDAMAYTTIDVCYRMASWLPRHLPNTMTGIAPGSQDSGVCVVGEGGQKT